MQNMNFSIGDSHKQSPLRTCNNLTMTTFAEEPIIDFGKSDLINSSSHYFEHGRCLDPGHSHAYQSKTKNADAIFFQIEIRFLDHFFHARKLFEQILMIRFFVKYPQRSDKLSDPLKISSKSPF